MTPTVSVCIPVFNGARFLPGAMSSLASQRFRDFEVIVVDDGSTDGSAEQAQRLLEAHALTGRVIRESNHGNAVARDIACEAARGTFLAPLDCDDTWDPGYLESMVAALRAGAGVDLVYCDLIEWFADGRELRKSAIATWVDESQARRLEDLLVFPEGIFFKMLLRGQVLFPSCTVFTPALYRRAGGYAAKLPEVQTSLDWYFGLRAARAGTVAFLKRPLLRKYAHGDSVSNASFLVTEYSSFRILKDILKDRTLDPPERRNARWRGAFISRSCAYEAWAAQRRSLEAARWVARSLSFEWQWETLTLALKILIPRSLVDRVRGHARESGA